MAERGRSITQHIHLHVNASSLTDETTTIVHGDQVGTKVDVAAGRIGAVNIPGPNIRNAAEEQIVEGVEQMNLSKPSASTFSKLKKVVSEKGQPQGKATEGSSNEVRGVKIAFLKERSNALIGQSNYSQASQILEELNSLEGPMNFDTHLHMAECCLHIGREIKANKAIQAVRDIIMTSQSFTADDIYKLGSEMVGNSSQICGIILCRIAADMYETRASTPDDVVNGIYSCIYKTHDATHPLIKAGGRSRVIGLDIGVENMIEMNQRLKAVKNAKPENKALKEAWSNNLIGYNLVQAGENEKSIKYCKTGIEILQRQFSSNAAKYRIYGHLLHNLGAAHHNLGKYSEAEPYYVKTIEAYEKATDYADESAKQKNIELAKNDLKKSRAELGK